MLDEELDAADDLVAQLDGAGGRCAREEIGAVGLADDVERLEQAVRDTSAERREAPVRVHAVAQVEHGPAGRMPAVARVRRDPQLTRRAEALLDDRLRPVPERRVRARGLRRIRDRKADLRAEREPDAVVDARDPPLRMQREEAERLLVELRRRPPRLGRQGGACDRRLLRVARHEIDGDVEADDEAVEDAVVELQRPLERVVDELRAPLPDRGHAQESVAVVDDETERDLVGAQDLGPVRDE